MSFDVTLWASDAGIPDAQRFHAFFEGDDRFIVDRSWPTDVYTVTAVGVAAGYAVFDVERFDPDEVAALDEEERDFLPVVPGLTWTGIRFELSYASIPTVAKAAFDLLAAVCDALELLAVDEQGEDTTIALDELRESWGHNVRLARGVATLATGTRTGRFE